MRVPRIISHVFDNESKSVTFGYMLYASANYGAFVAKTGAEGKHVLGADEFLFLAGFASILVGGKLAAETMGARWGLKAPAEVPHPPAAPGTPA
jgi:hypothetical protein